nr:hypothetical protein [Flavobacteriales bacterium]
GQRNDRRNDRPRQDQRRDQQRPAQDQRPREQQRERSGSAAKPDYAALTKELFGEELERTKGNDQQKEKKKGFGLGRLFGR